MFVCLVSEEKDEILVFDTLQASAFSFGKILLLLLFLFSHSLNVIGLGVYIFFIFILPGVLCTSGPVVWCLTLI